MKALRSILALMSVSPAAAAKPVVYTEDLDIDYLVENPSPCPGIEVRDHEVFSYSYTVFYDGDGNFVRWQVHATGTDNFYNPANPDVVLSGNFVHNARGDGISEIHMGIPYHITVPGYGAVYVEAGRWFADGRIVGHHDSIEPGGLDAFCSLLAGD